MTDCHIKPPLDIDFPFQFPEHMDPPYRLQSSDVQTDRVLSRLEWTHPEGWTPDEPSPHALPSNTPSHYATPDLWPSSASTLQSGSYYSVVSSPSYSMTNSGSTWSYPYSVTSINSRKSRKNVLYPRRAHPLPQPPPRPRAPPPRWPLPSVTPPPSPPSPPPPLIGGSLPLAVPVELSHDARIWFFCTSLLPHTETRLVPAGKVLLKSLGLLGKFSQLVPAQTDEATRCCSELFITLTHEVHLNCAVRAEGLEGPCKLLHTTFKDILHKSGTFSFPKTSKWSTDGSLTLLRLYNALLALFSVLNTFEGVLDTIKINRKYVHHEVHYRVALLELSTPTGLTMETYRTKLGQHLAQTEAQLNCLRQSEGLPPPSTSLISRIRPHKEVPQEISTIEEDSETEGEGRPVNGHTLSSGDSGKNSFPRRILRRLIPSSLGRKDL